MINILSRKVIRAWYWGTIVLGVVLPITVMVVADITFKRSIESSLSLFFTDFGFLLLMHDIPFILVALLIKSGYSKSIATPEGNISRFYKIIGAWSLLVVSSLLFNIDISATLSSTSSLSYIIFSFWGIILSLLGYASGWIMGKFIIKYNKAYRGVN